MTVLTSVTEAPSEIARPFSVTRLTLPTVENDAPAWEMMVPTMVPPPAALMVAALPTCQIDVLRLRAAREDDALRSRDSRAAHGQRLRHLEHEHRVRIALRIEREVAALDQERTARRGVDTRRQGE